MADWARRLVKPIQQSKRMNTYFMMITLWVMIHEKIQLHSIPSVMAKYTVSRTDNPQKMRIFIIPPVDIEKVFYKTDNQNAYCDSLNCISIPKRGLIAHI
jgi:hypothetical protein